MEEMYSALGHPVSNGSAKRGELTIAGTRRDHEVISQGGQIVDVEKRYVAGFPVHCHINDFAGSGQSVVFRGGGRMHLPHHLKYIMREWNRRSTACMLFSRVCDQEEIRLVPGYDMRFTIVDPTGTISLVGDGFFMLPLVAACAANPPSLSDMLNRVDQIDRRLRDHISAGLAVFDEHNVEGDYAWIHRVLEESKPEDDPVFRVVDDVTRQRSLEPTHTGLLIFNLKDHRIVQVLNHFYAVERDGEVHLHNGDKYSRRTVTYSLPESWSIVP